uniref:Uncharacterized protein n=1 Tax=Picea sitchensis TaxID=3332 RepID=A9NMY8_PICSI|nr:unknown [Picea sitchensis]ACN39980.1 unknown [Picea sitchensis]
MRPSNVLLLVLCFCLLVQLAQPVKVTLKIDHLPTVVLNVPAIGGASITSAGGESGKDGATMIENHQNYNP